MVDSKKYEEWLQMAKKDLQSVKILFEHDGDYGIVCFHCQQAIEKYLKGFLIFKSGKLAEGHSLLRLCKKAAEYDQRFTAFVKDCSFVNNFYIAKRHNAKIDVKTGSAGTALYIRF